MPYITAKLHIFYFSIIALNGPEADFFATPVKSASLVTIVNLTGQAPVKAEPVFLTAQPVPPHGAALEARRSQRTFFMGHG